MNLLHSPSDRGVARVGRFAIQIAAVYKFRILTTCGSRSFDLVKSLGANHVLDHYDGDVIEHIRNLEPTLEYVFDTVGSPSSAVTASRALVSGKGNLCTINPEKDTSDIAPSINVTNASVWRAFLQSHWFNGVFFAVSSSMLSDSMYIWSANVSMLTIWVALAIS